MILYQNIKRITVVVVGLFLLFMCLFPVRSQAAAALCYQNVLAPGGFVDCSSFTKLAPGVTIQPDKCYQYAAINGDLLGTEADCNNAPFKKTGNTVRCNDDTLQTGAPGDSTDVICRNNGGYTASGDNILDNADCKVVDLNSGNCRIILRLNQLINALSVLVGIVVTIMIIFGGIQYSAAGEDPNAVAKAKKHIAQAVLALVGYGITFAFLQYIIPGGLL